jgi:two-component system KDP operon response regulator KdpE
MSGRRVLIVEDDRKMQRLLSSQLTVRGFEVQVVASGPDALVAVADNEPSLMLLDITLPGMDGLEVCRQVREWSTVPIILVTAADLRQTKVAALEMGGDDYLTKPFHVGELVARINAVLRRAEGRAGPHAAVIEAGDLRIDLARREVWKGGVELHLTKIEFDLVRELATHADMVLTHKQLLSAVRGTGYEDIRPVQVHICNLRRKLEPGPTSPRYILTVPGVGYRFRHRE